MPPRKRKAVVSKAEVKTKQLKPNDSKVYTKEILQGLTRREIQGLCKLNGKKAGGKSVVLIESLIGCPIAEAATEVKSTSPEATTNKKRPASDNVPIAATKPPKTRPRMEIKEIVDLDRKKEQKVENVPAPTPTQVKSRPAPAQVQSKYYHEDDERVTGLWFFKISNDSHCTNQKIRDLGAIGTGARFCIHNCLACQFPFQRNKSPLYVNNELLECQDCKTAPPNKG